MEINEDLVRESKTYREILEHRRNCNKWGKEFCIYCFGGGLNNFFRDLERESTNN